MIVWNRRQVLLDILEEKAQSRQRAEAEALKKRDEIARVAPVYAHLEQELGSIRMELSRLALERPGEQAALNEEARRRVYALRDRARAELAAAGYTPEDLKPRYGCPICRDTGFVGAENMPQTRCECVTRELRRRLYALGGAQGHSFEDFDLAIFPDEPAEGGGPSQRQSMQKARDYALAFAEKFPQVNKPNLLVSGAAGLGKTYLLDCITLRVLERGFPVLRASAFQMFESMRSYHRGQEMSGFQDMLSCALLSIDDLGTEPMMQNITQEYLFTLLSERKARGLSTLIATNLDMRALLSHYGERSFSRLTDRTDTTVLHLSGKDLRRRQ